MSQVAVVQGGWLPNGMPTPIYNEEGFPLYQPLETQNLFHGADTFEVLFGGSTGPGKTRAIGEDALTVALEAPGAKIMVARLKEKDVKATTMAVFMEEVFPQLERGLRDKCRWKTSDLELKLWPDETGRRSSIKFMGLLSSSGAEDVGKIKSTSVSVLYGDEITEWPEKLFLMWHTQIRHVVPNLRRNQIKMATNPEPGTWPYYRYIVHRETGKPWTKEELLERGRMFIPAFSRDNPFLPADYQARFDEMPIWMQKRYRDGDWSYFTGQAIKGWDESNVVIPWSPLDHRKVATYIYIDHGQTNPCSVHRYNIDSWGNKVVDDEYYSSGLISKHCEAIAKMAKGVPNLYGLYIDGTVFAKTGERSMELWSIADEYNKHLAPFGLSVLPSPSSGTIDKTKIERWESALAWDDNRQHPIHMDKRGGQEIWVMSNCVNMIREIPTQKWKDPPTIDGEVLNAPEKLVDRDNHAFDESSYFLCDHESEEFEPDFDGHGEKVKSVEYIF
jgi:hypothetical protein